jgi:hypothetical protein
MANPRIYGSTPYNNVPSAHRLTSYPEYLTSFSPSVDDGSKKAIYICKILGFTAVAISAILAVGVLYLIIKNNLYN